MKNIFSLTNNFFQITNHPGIRPYWSLQFTSYIVVNEEEAMLECHFHDFVDLDSVEFLFPLVHLR